MPDEMVVDETLRERVLRLRNLMDKKDEIKAAEKEVNKAMGIVKGELKVQLDAMGDGMHKVSLRLDGIGTLSKHHKTLGNVRDKDAAHAALLEIGRDDIFELKPNASRLNALAKEYTEQGLEEPSGIEFVYVEDVRLLRARS